MIYYLIYSTISLGLLLLIYHLLLETEKMHHINRGYLVFSLLFSLTIPLIPVGIGEQFPGIVQSWYSDTATTSSANIESEPSSGFIDSEIPGEWLPPTDQTDSAKGFPVFPLMISLYGIISLLLFARLFRVIHIIQMKADRNPRKLYENCELVLLREKVVPHTFMSTIFVNRDEYKSGRIGRDILIHEQAHATQKHTFDLLLIEVLKAIFWFNPLLYLYKRAMQLNHEYLADQAVINAGIKIKEYQSLLLNTVLSQPAYGLSHSFTFSLTKKRLQMMTQPVSPFRTSIKTLAIIPLFFILGFLFGCESIPSDSAQNQMNIHIEFTDAEYIIFNGEEMPVSELEDRLESLADHYELHFILENHPDMLAGPVMKVNRLVQNYKSGEQGLQENHLTITVTTESWILINDKPHNLNEVQTVLDEYTSRYNLIAHLRVEGESDVSFINEVQGLLRQYQVSRINYSVLKSSPTEDVLLEQLNRAGSKYMAIPPEPANIDELNEGYEEFMEAHKRFYEEQKRIYSDDPTSLPPPPPVPPAPQVRIDKDIKGIDLVNPPPPPPPPPIDPRNVLRILVNAQGMLLANEQPVEPSKFRQFIMDFIENRNSNPELPVRPDQAIIALKPGINTPMSVFNETLGEILAAYDDLRDEASMNRFGVPFNSLKADSNEREMILGQYPKRIAAAEPNQ